MRGQTLFDRFVVNANLVEATRSAMSVFAARIRKPFVVDPITYAFGLDPTFLKSLGKGEPRLKSTFASLGTKYGVGSENEIVAGPLRPGDFGNRLSAESFVANVLQYQDDCIWATVNEDALFLSSEVLDNQAALRPAILLAPYFVDDFTTGWRAINLDCARLATEQRGSRSGAVIAYDSRLSDGAALVSLHADWAETAVEDVFLWATDLDERSAAAPTLQQYADLVQRLADSGKSPRAAYGGFFALLLSLPGACRAFARRGVWRQTKPRASCRWWIAARSVLRPGHSRPPAHW